MGNVTSAAASTHPGRRGGAHTTWTTSSDDAASQLALSDHENNMDDDSDVEYDAQTLSAPTPSANLETDKGAGTVRTAGDMLNSMPLWAAEGVADEQCSSSLELQFVYGVRGTDCRRNAFFTASGEVAFHSATLIVMYEPRRHTQRFLRGHDGEIRCLALHPSGRVLASGQAAGGRTEICVWQLDATDPASVLTGQHSGGVVSLSFSPSGERLAAVGSDPMHTLVLWDWRRGTPLAAQQIHSEPIFALSWSPVEAALATVGVRCVKIWGVFAEESGLTGRSAQLLPSGKVGMPEKGNDKRSPNFLCCAYLRSGMLVAGTSRGEVWCWSGTALCARFRAHDGPVFCLEVERTEGWLLSGGKDSRLRLWSPSVRSPLHPPACPTPLPSFRSQGRP